jgi:hypothetical protein
MPPTNDWVNVAAVRSELPVIREESAAPAPSWEMVLAITPKVKLSCRVLGRVLSEVKVLVAVPKKSYETRYTQRLGTKWKPLLRRRNPSGETKLEFAVDHQ